jgi:methylenetetrahydrofolate reductase (NADPH)
MASSEGQANGGVDRGAAGALRDVLARPKYELVPTKSVDRAIEELPPGAVVTVTASPHRTIEETTELTVRLRRLGFAVVPHLAARMIQDRDHLRLLLDGLGEAGVSGAFVIGGDAQQPGAYPDALALLRDMNELGHPFTAIGIAGYPEGHPFITDDLLDAALREKAAYASYVTTQMCFDPEAITTWIEGRRDYGIGLPVHLGIPGVAEIGKLIRLGTRIGIGGSLRYLSRHTGLVGRLVRPGGYTPDALLEGLGAAFADRRLGIEAVHVFTFNEVATTEAWRRRYLDVLAVDAGGR